MNPVSKRVLYFAPLRHTFDELCEAAARSVKLRAESGDSTCNWSRDDLALDLVLVDNVEEAVSRVEHSYLNLVVVDCRHLPHAEADAPRQEEELHRFLDALRDIKDRETRYPFQRILVLVGDADEDRVDRLIFELGRRHVGGCLRDLSLSPRLVGSHVREARERLLEQFWEFCYRNLVERRSGRKAISAAGGAITGIYYELGVLKCLDDALDLDLRDFDLYFGISAGAIITACLANGISIDELILAVGGVSDDWPERFRLRWTHLNVGEMPRRFLHAQQDLASYFVELLRGKADFSVASVVGAYGTMIGPMFDNTMLRRFFQRQFSADGRTDDFRELRGDLYIGATDQDLREHVLFGDTGFEDVPISQAIQASTAAHPFFRSVEIDGSYYTDGMLTRTSNIKAAIGKGADLVFVIDPFVPMVSTKPGVNARHGSLWLIEQDIKTLAYTRFEQVSDEILKRNSHVSAYTFVPSNRMRRLMSQNPFAARNFDPIVCAAYRSTFRRLQRLEYKLSGELRSHDFHIDLAPVEAKVERLRQASRPDVQLLLEPVEGLEPSPEPVDIPVEHDPTLQPA